LCLIVHGGRSGASDHADGVLVVKPAEPPCRRAVALRRAPARFVFGERFDYLLDPMRNSYDEQDVQRMIGSLASQVMAAFDPHQPLSIVGIRTRGEALAERLWSILVERGHGDIQRGVLDITLYRDDLSEIGPKPMVRPTEIRIDIGGSPLLLVDDVLFTGRSVRAALDALNDFGRPSAIRLAVLVDRGGRELPIAADFVGLTLGDVPPDHRVNVRLRETDGRDEIVVEPQGQAS
jgi:pyrimidine operon attenuation protein/uracil phosphoribosyltransferase